MLLIYMFLSNTQSIIHLFFSGCLDPVNLFIKNRI